MIGALVAGAVVLGGCGSSSGNSSSQPNVPGAGQGIESGLRLRE